MRQIAVCNLASIALNRYVTSDRVFDFKQLEYVTSVIVKNLNRIIEVNYYPVPEVTVSLAVSFLCCDHRSERTQTQVLTRTKLNPKV